MFLNIQNRTYHIYGIDDFPYEDFSNCSTVERGKKKYFDVVSTFDIETTTVVENDKDYFGFMYVWQFCIEETTCIGRTWEEYRTFLQRLKKAIGVNKTYKLVTYVHNLSFEFQFMRNFFKIDKVFARNKRDVVYAVIEGVEYRCSYALSNMSLDKFLKNTKGVTAYKMSGKDFNYRVARYPDTPLTEEELKYCVVDVIGLCQAIKSKLEEDDLISIPITSTGYVRRDYREACLSDAEYRHTFLDIALTPHTYALCKEATRGGIAGSNACNTYWTIDDVDSFDKKSSYPAQMLTKYFPMSKFAPFKSINGNDVRNNEQFMNAINTKCCLLVWHCKNLRLKHWDTIPYISRAKCRALKGCKSGNGKVYKADEIGMCCTEIDFQIIMKTYDFDECQVYEMWIANRGLLPKPFRKHLSDMFQIKTDLEDGDKYVYAKYKNKINASFGMMLTDILNPSIIYNPNSTEPWKEEEITDVRRALRQFYNNKNSFLAYQWGTWVTAHARKDLVEGIIAVGDDLVLTDTDSVKTIGNHKEAFEKINKRIRANAESYDIKPYAIKNGKKVYLGVWEHENDDYDTTYKQFKTLGAKKYCYIENGSNELEITVSGLRKNANGWLEKHGGFNSFTKGVVVPPIESGRTASRYNDEVEPRTITIDGHSVTLGSNIGIKDVSYTFGVTDDWLEMICNGIDGDADRRFS